MTKRSAKAKQDEGAPVATFGVWDVIDSETKYAIGMVEKLLGIPAETMREASRNEELPRAHGGLFDDFRVRGDVLLEWIERNNIPCVLTEHAEEVINKRSREQAISDAKAAMERARAEAEAAERKRRDALEREYVGQVRKVDAGQADAARMAELAQALDIPHDHIAVHAEHLQKVEVLRQRAAALEDARAGVVQVRDEIKALEKRHEQERAEVQRKHNNAEVHLRRCHSAEREAKEIRRRFPILFSKGDGFPEVRE